MMKESDIVFLNGEFLLKDRAKISVFDRGFIFGDGIYEVVPVMNGVLIDKIEFWERFKRSLKEIALNFPYKDSEFESILNELIAKNALKEGGVYMQITRGIASRDFAFTKGLKPTIMAFVYAANIQNNELASKGISVVSVPDIRWKRRDIKSISLLAQCYAKEMAVNAGADEGFMVENGKVTEATSASAFIIKDKTLITKPFSNEILPGIRRQNILKFARELNLSVAERAFSMNEVYEADEVFISAASLPILGVIKADGKVIANGKVGKFTQLLRQRYLQKMRNEAGLKD